MVQTLEAIKGGGGSIKVGTTGTISALMSRELEYVNSAHVNSAPQMPPSCRNTSPPQPISGVTGDMTARRLKSKVPMDEASSSTSTSNTNHKEPTNVRKTRHYNGKAHQIPILKADNMSIDATPMRKKPAKKGSGIVEIVDIKCGHPDKAWARLKKLGFSKLSESSIL